MLTSSVRAMNGLEDSNITPRPLRVVKTPQMLPIIPKRQSSTATLPQLVPLDSRRSYRSDPFPAGGAAPFIPPGPCQQRPMDVENRPVERRFFGRFRRAFSGSMRLSSNTSEGRSRRLLSRSRSSASRQASGQSSVTSIFTPGTHSDSTTLDTDVHSNPLRAPPASLFSPANHNYSTESIDWPLPPKAPPLAHASMRIIPDVETTEDSKTQFIWVAVEINARNFVAYEPHGNHRRRTPQSRR